MREIVSQTTDDKHKHHIMTILPKKSGEAICYGTSN